MFGVTPFVGMGMVEFEGAVDGLRIDSRLVKEGASRRPLYVAVAGARRPRGSATRWSSCRSRRSRPGWPPAAAARRRRRRRCCARRSTSCAAACAAPPRTARALDAEVASCGARSTEADESVVNLTRKTAEEMAAMAERLRPGCAPTRERARLGGAGRGARRGRSPSRAAGRGRSARQRGRAAPGRGGRRARERQTASWRTRSSGCGWPTASWRARVATPARSRRRRAQRRPIARRRSKSATWRSRRATNGSPSSRARSRIWSGGWRSWRTS